MPLTVRLRRLGYRTAYAVLRVYWFLFRPSHSGIKCVLTRADEVLLVRHTYGPDEWELPGGGLKAKESPRAGATREMLEELGIEIVDWNELGEVRGTLNHVRNRLHVLGCEIENAPLTPDAGEIAEARWFARSALPEDLGGYTAMILGRGRAGPRA